MGPLKTWSFSGTLVVVVVLIIIAILVLVFVADAVTADAVAFAVVAIIGHRNGEALDAPRSGERARRKVLPRFASARAPICSSEIPRSGEGAQRTGQRMAQEPGEKPRRNRAGLGQKTLRKSPAKGADLPPREPRQEARRQTCVGEGPFDTARANRASFLHWR